MKDDNWRQFIKTGRVIDYLNYTACTSEKVMLKVIGNMEKTEDIKSEGNNMHHRDSAFRNGSRRV